VPAHNNQDGGASNERVSNAAGGLLGSGRAGCRLEPRKTCTCGMSPAWRPAVRAHGNVHSRYAEKPGQIADQTCPRLPRGKLGLSQPSTVLFCYPGDPGMSGGKQPATQCRVLVRPGALTDVCYSAERSVYTLNPRCRLAGQQHGVREPPSCPRHMQVDIALPALITCGAYVALLPRPGQ
jgi:hypothetical protein